MSDLDTIKQELLDQLKNNPEALLAKSISVGGKTYVFRDLSDILNAIKEIENSLGRKWRKPVRGVLDF